MSIIKIFSVKISSILYININGLIYSNHNIILGYNNKRSTNTVLTSFKFYNEDYSCDLCNCKKFCDS